MKDHYGNPITTTSDAARAAYDRAVTHFLSGDHGAVEAFTDALTADQGFALAHAGLARARVMAGDMPGARAAVAKAAELAQGTTARERSHIATLELLLSGQVAAAKHAALDHVQDHPRDAMIAQLCTNIYGLIGFSGEVAREAALFAYTSALLPHYGDDWWMMSMHALSLCETGQPEASLSLMERALESNPRNAHGSHFKAHALYEMGETAQGRAYLAAWMEGYDDRALIHGHLSWHQALWALHDGDRDAMWAAVDAGVGPGAAKGLPINIVTDTAAILYRAELAGVAVAPRRWQELSQYAATHFAAPGQSFVDLHAALAHAMAGEGDRLRAIAETSKGFAADLVRPVAAAWQAIAAQDWDTALQLLTPVMAENVRLGGSRAQRDLLELTYANVLLRTGHAEEARRSLRTRRPVLAEAPPVSGLH